MRRIVVLCTIGAALATQQGVRDVLDWAFDNKVELLLEQSHVPGLSLAVVHDGEITAKGYGFSQLPSTPATADTLYFTGSTTKAFTAAAIGKIILGHHHLNSSRADLKWSTPLHDILGNDFVLACEYASQHTSLEDAMSHRSGIPRHDNAYGWGEGGPSTTNILRTMRYLPFSAEPRTKWQYNNLMFAAVGEVLTRLTGANSLEDVLRDWLWRPLGMESTTFSIADADAKKDSKGRSRLARGYFWTGDHYVPDRWIDILPVAGAGATISSVNDYALWARNLLNAQAGWKNESSPVDKELFDALTTPRSIMSDLGVSGAAVPTYALGWIIGNVAGKTIITHGGGLPGFGTQLYLVPELDLAFVSVGNTAGSSAGVGASLFVEVLCKLGVPLCGEDQEEHIDILNKISSSSKSQSRQEGELYARPAMNDKLPLPGDVGDYLGAYTHPAYGVFNISVSKSSNIKTPSRFQAFSQEGSQQTFRDYAPGEKAAPPIFQVTPSSRTWDQVYVITHSTYLSFDIDAYDVHGPAPKDDSSCSGGEAKGRDLKCKNAIAMQWSSTARAVFERGVDGDVERLGMEIEDEVVGWAREEEGRKGWRDGMIWFDKI